MLQELCLDLFRGQIYKKTMTYSYIYIKCVITFIIPIDRFRSKINLA